jgi:hypothetical protein
LDHDCSCSRLLARNTCFWDVGGAPYNFHVYELMFKSWNEFYINKCIQRCHITCRHTTWHIHLYVIKIPYIGFILLSFFCGCYKKIIYGHGQWDIIYGSNSAGRAERSEKWPVEIKSLPLYILTDKKLHRPSYVLTRRVYILNGRFI